MQSANRSRLIRPAIVMLALSLLVLFSACSRVPLPDVKMPRVSMPKLPAIGGDDEPADQTTTPRDLLGAKLINPKSRDDMPNMTVGKLIEFADRYLACDCATTRFVRAWEQTPGGYRLTTNSEVVEPLEFVCSATGEPSERECYLTEIDRGQHSETLTSRFVPGSQFIQFLYENGVRCERESPCP